MVRKSRTTVFIRYALSYLAVVLLLFFSITGYLYATMSEKAREEYIRVYQQVYDHWREEK